MFICVCVVCDACNGAPSTSSARCTCSRCGNCGTRSSTPICPRCIQLGTCRYCRRHLPANAFDNDSDNVCWACRNKRQKKNTRQVCNETVNEVDVMTDRQDTSFEVFLSRNSQHIQSVIDNYCHRLR